MDAPEQNQRSLRIGELAKVLGTTTKTLRHYERMEILHPPQRTDKGYRIYDESDLRRARQVVDLRRIGLSIGNSPLVKTAIAGEDPNWGRIVMAVGKSGEAADRDGLEIRIGGHLVASEGNVDPDYDEAAAARHMKGRAIAIEVDVAVGRGHATVWTCDLTRGYIEINADYRS